MTNFQASHRPSEQGFTLVELAIVMVIIGILIGGILKGQELIATAKVSSTVGQVEGVEAALNTFQEKYNSLPGDMVTPQTRLPNCTAAPCRDNGTGGTIGNGRIEGGNVIAPPVVANEAGKTFVHLNAADLLSGIVPATGAATFGGIFPVLRAGGGMWVSFRTGNAVVNGTTLPAGRHYFTLSGDPQNAVGNATGALNTSTAAQIDRKMDDGKPQVGAVQTIGTGCFTGTGTAAVYDESTGGGTCTMYLRALN